MRKILSLIFLLCAVCLVSAKDVIVLKNAETVEAKILEVTSNEIKYKRLNNLNGPTFSVNISEVSTVVYENGDVESFAKKASVKEENTASSEPVKNEVETKSEVNKLPHIEYGKVLLPNGKRRRRYHGGGMYMKSREFESYLQANCYEAYKYYRKASNLSTVGLVTVWFCWPVGLGFAIASTVPSSKVLPTYNDSCATGK